MSDDPELQAAFLEFLHYFEVVFDADWWWSRQNMGEPFISDAGTFINPLVQDEENDWGNRHSLLKRFRAVKALLEQRNDRDAPK